MPCENKEVLKSILEEKENHNEIYSEIQKESIHIVSVSSFTDAFCTNLRDVFAHEDMAEVTRGVMHVNIPPMIHVYSFSWERNESYVQSMKLRQPGCSVISVLASTTALAMPNMAMPHSVLVAEKWSGSETIRTTIWNGEISTVRKTGHIP